MDELRRAADAQEFFLVYQPVIDLQSGAFAGVEALLRWRHPSRGVLGPEAFLSDLADSDLIAQVGRWVLASACRQGAQWHRKGYRFSVSVNVAPRQFSRRDFVDDVMDALTQSRLNPTLLTLELPERAITKGNRDVSPRLARLVDLGIRVCVDDFDLGRSTLASLEGFPVRAVKISRDSLAAVTSGRSPGAAALRELVDEARGRGVVVLASGVEDADQRELLAAEHVAAGQGYLFSRPHEVAEIDRFLEDYALFSGKPL
ncbi:MAG TPA: EAL domain-containing protein [Acidimicrobiales bacterium]|nr:EAL domain-containing protein [Acidimicrobiales bacterium]